MRTREAWARGCRGTLRGSEQGLFDGEYRSLASRPSPFEDEAPK